MHKNYGFLIPFVLLLLLAIPSYFTKMNKISVDMSTISSQEFEENQAWIGGVLLANQHAYTCNGLIYYTNLEKGISQPLCSIPDCLHNSDECMAFFSTSFAEEFLYCFEGKLYAGGSDANNSLCFYRCDLDGSNHEKIAEVPVDGAVDIANCYVDGSDVYIAVILKDNSDVKVMENGFMTDAPAVGEIWCFHSETHEFKRIYSFSENAYQVNLNIRYIRDEKCYYEYCGQEVPMEQVYDVETGEALDSDYEKYEFEEVGTIDLNTGKREIMERYRMGDYIGCKDGLYYYYDEAESGDIRVEDYENGSEKKIHISEMEGENYWNCSIFLTGNGLVVNEQEWMADTGRMLFYDWNGNKKSAVENSSLFVVGEYQDFYLLNSNGMDMAEAYVLKKDIDKINKKAVYLWNEE